MEEQKKQKLLKLREQFEKENKAIQLKVSKSNKKEEAAKIVEELENVRHTQVQEEMFQKWLKQKQNVGAVDENLNIRQSSQNQKID